MGRKISTKKLFYILLLTLFVSGFFVISSKLVSASSTDGTIDPTYEYAWGENIGWINFGTSNGNVHVTDSALSGYALSETVGWINLNGVANDGEGNLSGYAWGENVGYIKFNPTNGGVTINSSGEFSGSALSENVGWIIFGGDYKVKTDWRPQSARICTSWTYSDWSSCSGGQQTRTIVSSSPSGCSGGSPTLSQNCSLGGGGGGGGGLPPEAYNPPIAPEGGFKILINDDAAQTDSRKVNLTLKGGSNTKAVWISENSQFPEGFQVSYNSSLSQASVSFDLSLGEGQKTVYAKFCTQWGRCSDVVSDSIERVGETIIEKIEQVPQKIVEQIKKVPEIIAPLVPNFLKPKPKEEAKPPEKLIEELVSKETPLAFRGKWQLLPNEPIKEFVLAPLPKEIRNLAQKFPEFEKTLEEVGISKITDVAKLNMVKLTLPGLTERAGLPTTKVESGKFSLLRGVPVAKLSPAIKQQLPTEIVFAKTGGELIDFNIDLSVSDKGEPQQKIATISGKPLQLVVKPDKPVKSIKGYVVFKAAVTQATSMDVPLNSLLASVIFANPVFAKTQDQPVRVEEKLVLLEFEYTDPDGDGIYTAEIDAPVVAGEYEIITVMDFDDPEFGKKEIRLTTVVDPEGYIYTYSSAGKTRIAGAIVYLYWLNPETKQYEIWPAKEYQQENPQITTDTGSYSFLVPPGAYYLKVEAPKYPAYQSDTFQIKEGSGVHMNVELKSRFWWLDIFDWKIVIMIIFGILLLYNFYHDKIRERKNYANFKSK